MKLDQDTALSLLQALPIGVFLTDRAGVIRWANPACQALLGYEAGAAMSPGADPVGYQELPRTPDETVEWQLPSVADASPRCLLCRRLQDIGEEAAYLLEDVSMQHALRTQIAEFRSQAHTHSTRDALTGLPNRRGMIDLLESQITRSRRYHNPLAVLRLDLLGDAEEPPGVHEAMLLAVARQLKDQLRWADVCGHWNESSFLLIMPETDAEAGGRLADKLIIQLRHVELGIPGKTASLLARAAVTAWTKGDDLQKMMTRVNALMSSAGARTPPIAIG
jgi:diguanylate cyclase (GGDEF)-like protein